MGIELPNADRQMVSFKELAACEAFADHKGNLPIILGKDIAGEPVVADLAAMPHLLVAGTTGSGKSVGLNCILLSLLYRFTPAQCRLILIDPKMLELKSYDDIPHLLSPVVTEPAKSVRALKWAVEEMERRYRMMSDIGVRNINGFNEKVQAALAKGKPLGRRVQAGFDPDTGEEVVVEDASSTTRSLPQIVLIVDELADLMVTVGKEIEVLIQRLSQKSRAAGIHLIMATQRPSVDVITGVIKANLPTRVSFARHQPHRQPHDPRRAGRRAAARQGRHALQAQHRRDPPRPRPVRQRRGSRARRRVTGAARARPNTSIRSPRSPRTAASASRTIHRQRQPRGAQVPPGLPDRVREPEGLRLAGSSARWASATTPPPKWIERMEARRLRRPGQPCRPARDLSRPRRQPPLDKYC